MRIDKFPITKEYELDIYKIFVAQARWRGFTIGQITELFYKEYPEFDSHRNKPEQPKEGKDIKKAIEQAADEYVKQQGSHDNPDITKHDFTQGYIAAYTASVQPLIDLIRECEEYLSQRHYVHGAPIQLNSIGAGSILHTKMKTILSSFPSSPNNTGEWMKDRPKFEEPCLLITRSRIRDYWDYSAYIIDWVKSDDGRYMGWLCLDGEEYGDLSDLQAQYYCVLPLPEPPKQ